MSMSVAGYFWLVPLLCGVQGHEVVQTYDPVKVTVHPKLICLVGNRLPRDCGEVYKAGRINNGVYMIQPAGCTIPFKVYCEMTRTEGWTVIMSRFDGSVDFNRSWAEYKKGFGDVYGEYWVGNDHIHRLTNQRHYKLRVDFRLWPDLDAYNVDYTGFLIHSEERKYMLNLGSFKSCTSAYNGLGYHNGKPFSTFDSNNGNCAKNFGGGFWYGGCHHANPTGLYQMSCSGSQKNKCMEWDRKPTRAMIFKIAPSTTI